MLHTPYKTPSAAPGLDALEKPARRERADKREAGTDLRDEQAVERQLLGAQRGIEAIGREQRGTRRLLWTIRRELLADQRDRLAERRDKVASAS